MSHRFLCGGDIPEVGTHLSLTCPSVQQSSLEVKVMVLEPDTSCGLRDLGRFTLRLSFPAL